MISIIIPSHKEKELQRTVDELLNKAEGEVEIIVIMDGYWDVLTPDPRVKIIHFSESRGMRNAINSGVAISTGEYIMKTDAHCMFDQGYDVKMLEEMKDNYVMIPRRYKLDTQEWRRMDEEGFIDYDKLVILEVRNKFHGQEWISRRKERKDILVDETMSFQGSCWLMKRSWWDKIGELQEEGYGKFVMEPLEIGMKTFQAGGKLMINKKTWYAHKHRKFNRTHNVKREEADSGNAYALKIWKDEYKKLKEHFEK